MYLFLVFYPRPMCQNTRRDDLPCTFNLDICTLFSTTPNDDSLTWLGNGGNDTVISDVNVNDIEETSSFINTPPSSAQSPCDVELTTWFFAFCAPSLQVSRLGVFSTVTN